MATPARIIPMIWGIRRRPNRIGAKRIIISTKKKIQVGSVMGKCMPRLKIFIRIG
jgi:hypothetical protein